MALNASSTKSHAADPVLPLFIVILNWNLPDETMACVESVRVAVQAISQVRLVVVDNGSTDDSTTRLRRVVDSSCDLPMTLLETGTNLGFAGGMNVGIRWALTQGAATVLVLNNDTVMDLSMVGQLLADLAAHPEAGMVGPAIYFHDAPQRIWRFGDNEHQLWPIPFQLRDRVLEEAHGASFAVDYITACAMMVRTTALRSAGLFDERYFMYFEDADLCRRIRYAGYTIRVVPTAKVWHKVSLSANRDRPRNRRARAWSRVRFYREHPHGRLAPLIHAYIWAKVLVVSLQDLSRGDFDLIGPLWRGTWEGYRPSRLSKQAADHGLEPDA